MEQLKKWQRQMQQLRVPALGTLEIVLIIAVLLAIALIFRENISKFAQDLISKVFDHGLIDSL